MSTALDHGRIVLSAIIPNRRDLLDKALRYLTEAHFAHDQLQKNIFVMLERYAAVTGAVMDATALGDSLRQNNVDAGTAATYIESFNYFAQSNIDEAAFTWSVQQLLDLSADAATEQLIVEAREIQKTGKNIGREHKFGHADARQYLLSGLATIDRDLSMQDSPEGDMRHEYDDMIADYAERKANRLSGKAGGILFGVDDLDAKVGGLQPGELVLMAGYSSDGKTSLCVQTAWSAAVEQGKNVVFFTTETIRPQVRRKLLARHSVLPQFEIQDGINSNDLKRGTLPEHMEDKLREVVSDFSHNPTYGKLYIAQVPRGGTISTLEARLLRYQRDFDVNFVVMDYLALLHSDRRRSNDREELGNIIKEAKVLATTFKDGMGVPFMSPWQVNRTARDNAERAGFYTSAALAETAEATNSADVIISLLAPSDNDERKKEVKGQILKSRDGETASSIIMDVDYATSYFASKSKGADLNALIGDSTPTVGGQFDALIGLG